MKRPPATRTLPVRFRHLIPDKCPNFSRTGSIRGMRRQFYGNHAQLVRCGAFIYNVSAARNEAEILHACTCVPCC